MSWEITDRLARVLYGKMEHLDPTVDEPDWDALPDGEKQFYLSCINRLLLEKELLEAALATYEVCV